MYQLGGHPLFLSANDLQIGRGEPVQDTARVLSRYLDGIMIRTFEQKEVEDLAEYGSIPIINGLTDFCHPCQILADLMTIREFKSSFDGLKMCFIGDGNNMANSWIEAAMYFPFQLNMAIAPGYEPDQQLLALALQSGAKIFLTHAPKLAVDGANYIYADVWASMGQEEEKAIREKAFAGYQINRELMAETNPGCMVQHCLPAHRGEEITADVFEEHAEEIFDEAENRLHAQKAVMYLLMGGEE